MSSSEQCSVNNNSENANSNDPSYLTPYPDEDTFRILLVTDTHLGHLERDDYRRYDSFRAFDEALSIGKQYNVDFVLHAGDLFDKNQPSRFTMVKTLQILRKHCLGNKPIHFQIVSDQTQNFPSTGCVNYQDPNYNISLPIFIQHGNHDDPAGLGNHAALEQLSATNLVNYVGRVDDLENIQIFPILMKKGITKLAVYPLGFIRDERLHRLFLHHKVHWVKPKNQNMKDWFNIAMLHQNRTRHTQQYKDCLPEEFLPKFLDVVYWGHEHECHIDLTESLSGNFFVTQPGSTVITSLSQSETKDKFCGIMEIKGEECRLVPKKLKTNRPFIFDDIVLEDHFEKDVDLQNIDDFLADKVNTMIAEAELEHPAPSQAVDAHLSFITNYTEVNEEHGDMSRWPLVRLRVDYTGFPKIRSAQFGQPFHGKVANPDEILLLHKRLGDRRKKGGDDEKDQEANLRQMRGGNLFNLATGRNATEPIEDIVSKNIMSDSSDALVLFPELDLLKSITEFVDKEDNNAIETYCDERLAEMEQKLIESKCLAEESEIHSNAAKYTAHRRNELRRQREMHLLQKEQDLEEKRNANIMDIDEVRRVAAEGIPNAANRADRNRNHNRNEKVKEETKDDVDDDDELMLFPKKKKANLHSFGFGNASQRIKEDMIANSQRGGEDEENDDDLDLEGLDELMVTPKHEQRGNEPVRKKRKLQRDDDVSNDVIASLLGVDSDDEDGDNAANEQRASYVVTDIPQSLSMRSDAVNEGERGDAEKKVNVKKKTERKKRNNKASNNKMETDQDEDERVEVNTQQSSQSTQSTQRRGRRARGRGRKNTASAWGSLLQSRAGGRK